MTLNLRDIFGKRCPALLWCMALASIFAVVAADAFIWEPDAIVVQHEHFKMKRWDARLNGLKVAILSDIHQHNGNREFRRLERIVRMTNAENPDIVLLLGDYFGERDNNDSTNATPEEIASRLAELQSKYGVFAVMGNHDWWGDTGALIDAFQRYGIPVLENQVITLTVNDASLNIVGLPDFSTRVHKINPGTLPSSDVPSLVMSHDPLLVAGCPDLPAYELIFSGHTHGGQVGVPLVRELITPALLREPYAYGHYEENGHRIFVTRGLGCSLLRMRLLCMPEIIIATMEQE